VVGGVATLLILFRIIDPPGVSGLPSAISTVLAPHLERTLKLGVWLGLASTITVTTGAWLSIREEGVKTKDGPQEIETVRVVGSGAT
jgi:hypothetical protein